MSSNYLQEHNLEIAYENYNAVYSGQHSGADSLPKTLDNLYMKFNVERPQDFTGHGLSVSDIVALRQNGVISCHYVDSVGFADVPAFLPENYLKNTEMAMEDDYGMIDGIINNGPKEQPEVKTKAPDLTMLLEEAKRTVQEDKTSRDVWKKAICSRKAPYADFTQKRQNSADQKRGKGFTMMNFTNDEMNLMCIYSAGGNRTGLMQELTEMKRYLENDGTELLALTESALVKLTQMTDEEFDELELYPDFDA